MTAMYTSIDYIRINRVHMLGVFLPRTIRISSQRHQTGKDMNKVRVIWVINKDLRYKDKNFMATDENQKQDRSE